MVRVGALMHKNDQGQDVRDAAETEEFVRQAHATARTEAELIAHAKANGVPGFVARRMRAELEAKGELEQAGNGRLRVRQQRGGP